MSVIAISSPIHDGNSAEVLRSDRTTMSFQAQVRISKQRGHVALRSVNTCAVDRNMSQFKFGCKHLFHVGMRPTDLVFLSLLNLIYEERHDVFN